MDYLAGNVQLVIAIFEAIKFYFSEKFSIQSENVDDNTGEKEVLMVWNR